MLSFAVVENYRRASNRTIKKRGDTARNLFQAQNQQRFHFYSVSKEKKKTNLALWFDILKLKSIRAVNAFVTHTLTLIYHTHNHIHALFFIAIFFLSFLSHEEGGNEYIYLKYGFSSGA